MQEVWWGREIHNPKFNGHCRGFESVMGVRYHTELFVLMTHPGLHFHDAAFGMSYCDILMLSYVRAHVISENFAPPMSICHDMHCRFNPMMTPEALGKRATNG